VVPRFSTVNGVPARQHWQSQLQSPSNGLYHFGRSWAGPHLKAFREQGAIRAAGREGIKQGYETTRRSRIAWDPFGDGKNSIRGGAGYGPVLRTNGLDLATPSSTSRPQSGLPTTLLSYPTLSIPPAGTTARATSAPLRFSLGCRSTPVDRYSQQRSLDEHANARSGTPGGFLCDIGLRLLERQAPTCPVFEDFKPAPVART